MKVFVCKFFQENNIEQEIQSLISRNQKQYEKISLFCVDYQIQKRLQMAGIHREILMDSIYDYTDELSWEKAYELSDKWHSSVEDNDALKCSGINFLSLEYGIGKYAFIIKFSKLCRRMVEQNCEILILILNKRFNVMLPDINSPKIKTIIYPSSLMRSLLKYVPFLRYPLFFEGYMITKLHYYVDLMFKKHSQSVQKGEQYQYRVLLVTPSYDIYTNATLAICNQCLRKGLFPYVVLDDNRVITIFQQHHIQYTIVPPLPVLYMGKFVLLLYRLKRHINLFYESGNNNFDGKLDEFSVGYLIKRTLLSDSLHFCYSVIKSIVFFEKLVRSISPDIVFVMLDTGLPQQMAVAVAKKYSIPSITTVAAMDWNAPRPLLRHLHADKFAAMGEKVKDIYVKSGVEPTRIAVTGMVSVDNIFKRDKEQDKRTLAKYNIDTNKSIIVLTTHPEGYVGDEKEQMIKGIIDTVLKLADTELIIKVHPREDVEPLNKIIAKYRSHQIRVLKDIDIYALLNCCELNITKYSATALEAMMFDKPVITINLSGKPDLIPYATEKAALGVYQYKDIEPAILATLYNQKTRERLTIWRDRFIYNYAFKADGKASQRIVELMENMIDTSVKGSA